MAKTKTHIIEQDKNGNCFPVEYVYLVRESESSTLGEEWSGSQDTTIYVFTDKDEAIKVARKLNKTKGQGCEFSKEGDFIERDYDLDEDIHYFDVQKIIINPIIKE